MMSHSPNEVVTHDEETGLIENEWLRDVIYDVIELISFAPTYEHEVIGTKVLCWLCKLYQMHSEPVLDYKAMWSGLDLTKQDPVTDHEKFEFNSDILWLIELWFIQIRLIMKQPGNCWYLSREALDLFAHRNPFMAWKLAHDALKEFKKCKNSWSQKELFVFIGNQSDHVDLPGDEGQYAIRMMVKDVAFRLESPLRNCLHGERSTEQDKRLLLA